MYGENKSDSQKSDASRVEDRLRHLEDMYLKLVGALQKLGINIDEKSEANGKKPEVKPEIKPESKDEKTVNGDSDLKY